MPMVRISWLKQPLFYLYQSLRVLPDKCKDREKPQEHAQCWLGQALGISMEQCLCCGTRRPRHAWQVSECAEQPLTGGNGNA